MFNFLRLFLLLCLFVPVFARADIFITEIMYDLEGSDTGREWVEIYNDGGDVDLADWWFYEGSNHGFGSESAILSSGAYAVIVDDINKFKTDHSGVSALVLDSSAFSLKNTGEYIAIRDADKNDVDGLTYTPLDEANGTGNSLQKVDGAWMAAIPTPGTVNEGVELKSEQMASDLGFPEYVPPELRPNISVDVSAAKIAIAGATVKFTANVYGIEGAPIENARCSWSFGDGTSKEGCGAAHSYQFPGEYRVVVDASSGIHAASAYLSIAVIPNKLYVSEVKPGLDSFIEIRNPSGRELDISHWRIKSDSGEFVFPEDTFIMPKSFLAISADTAGLTLPLIKGAVHLSYPEGKTADSLYYYGVLQQGESFNDIDGKIVITSQSPGQAPHLKPGVPSEDNGKITTSLMTETKKTAKAENLAVGPPSAPPINNLDVEHPSEEGEEIERRDVVASAAGSSGDNMWIWLLSAVGVGLLGAIGFVLSKNLE